MTLNTVKFTVGGQRSHGDFGSLAQNFVFCIVSDTVVIFLFKFKNEADHRHSGRLNHEWAKS
jgi:hypothetical protein